MPKAEAIIKRGFDITIAVLLLIVLAPVFVAIILAVRMTSSGGAFFRQQRVGQNGELFWLYKFRSMRANTGGIAITADSDPRITSIGKLLRQSKLDELPQLWNVFKGEMSLVAPRPEVARYVAHYTDEQRKVLCVRPGITGAAQLEYRVEEKVLAGRNDVEAFYIHNVMPAKLAIDLRYVHERSFWSDIRILFHTLRAIAK